MDFWFLLIEITSTYFAEVQCKTETGEESKLQKNIRQVVTLPSRKNNINERLMTARDEFPTNSEQRTGCDVIYISVFLGDFQILPAN